jgi:hypothetical protein
MNFIGIASDVVCIQEKSTSQKAKGDYQRQEYDEEDNIGPQRANEENEADEPHEEKPIGDAGIEARGLQSLGTRLGIWWSIRRECSKGRV